MSQRLNAILLMMFMKELLRLSESEKHIKSQMAALLIESAIATRKVQNDKTVPPLKIKLEKLGPKQMNVTA